MKVILIATISANGKVLLAENPNHQPPKDAIGFYIQKAVDAGNIIIGRKTFELMQQFPGGINQILPGVKIVLLSSSDEDSGEVKVMETSEKAIHYLSAKGFTQTVIGGGTQTYNAFLEKDLIDEMYLTIVPVITGHGGILGTKDELFTTFQLAQCKTQTDETVQLHLTKRG